MSGNPEISNYLTDVYHDWQNSRNAFPINVYPEHYWPIPFFGNPGTALVATVGVNPSSDEFNPRRGWNAVKSKRDWEARLVNYFHSKTPPHQWFELWRKDLKLLDVSHQAGTAVHLDVSYRPTTAMIVNRKTDPKEFRRMVELDIAWFFRLLPLCPRLRGLLTFGPVIRANGCPESLAGFVRKSAPRHGFTVLPDGGLSHASNERPPRGYFLHEVA